MAPKNKKGQQRPKEEIAEDYCFICKDGGDLLICEYKQCLKTYHFDCVKKDMSFSTSKEKWVCDWHSCALCHRTSQVQCYCCPKASCFCCIHVTELVTVKGKYGFCSNCLKLALLIEENRDADSDGEKVDLKDRETYEGLFMEYYKIIREKEGLSADNLLAAKNRLKTGQNILSDSEAAESGGGEEEEMSSDEGMDNVRAYKRKHKNKRLKKGLPVVQCVKSKRTQYCGWGSTSLIQFLKSIGKDTTKKLSQHDVYFIIRKYISEKNLPDPTKKKMIKCDENLQSIFRKKTLNKNKIFGLLEAHLVENIEESEEEEATYDSECEGKTPLVTCKTRKISKTDKGSLKKDTISSVPHSCYASVTAENIRLVYLRRSLLYELSKQPESFERKVIGSFVRIKSDPHDYYQRNSHQLVQVTGIMKSGTCENNTEIVLCVSKIPKETSINFLSDADFSEEECEDLRQKIKDGIIQKPTVVELQEKARMLHVDITKHWIAGELKILGHRIDQSYEKGWRRQFIEHTDRKKLLQTPTEQSRLLEDFPIVIPEIADLETKNQDTVDEPEKDEALPQLIIPANHSRRLEDVAYHEPSTDEEKGDEALAESILPTDPNDKTGGNGVSSAEGEDHCAPFFIEEGEQDLYRASIPVSPHNTTSATKSGEPEPSTLEEHPKQILPYPNDQDEFTSQTQQNADAEQTTSKKRVPLAAEMLDLDSESDDGSQPNTPVEQQTLEDPESYVWLISSPDGVQRKRKYSLSLLKRWTEASSYAFNYKVRKEGQRQEQAIPLSAAINLAFRKP